MNETSRSRRVAVMRGTCSVVLFMLLWEVVARSFFVPAIFPAPTVVFWKMLDYAHTGRLWFDIGMSLQRIIVGFAVGSVLGAILGLLLGSVPVARWLLDPPLQFFRFIPPIAWLTPVLIWFGIGETGRYVLITYTTMFMVMINTYAGVTSISVTRYRVAQCLGASRLQVAIYVVLPSSLPFILQGMQIGMANSIQTLVVAEMLAANEGLGHLVLHARVSLETELTYVAIFLLGVLGLTADTTFRRTTGRLVARYRSS